MKVSMYAVFDRASAIYDGPFPGQTDGVMVRNFTHTVMNADSAIAKSPEDFTAERLLDKHKCKKARLKMRKEMSGHYDR